MVCVEFAGRERMRHTPKKKSEGWHAAGAQMGMWPHSVTAKVSPLPPACGRSGAQSRKKTRQENVCECDR